MPRLVAQVDVDPVKIGDVFRLCYANTDIIALVAENNPLDTFDTTLEPNAASKLKVEWVLSRRGGERPLGYTSRGAATRCLDMCVENKIEIIPKEEL